MNKSIQSNRSFIPLNRFSAILLQKILKNLMLMPASVEVLLEKLSFKLNLLPN